MPKSEMILVAILQPGALAWEWRTIPNTLKAKQAIVDGRIELVDIEAEASIYVNEEGKLLNLDPAAVWFDVTSGEPWDVLCGPILVCGPSDDDGNETSLTEEGLAQVRASILSPEEAQGIGVRVPVPRMSVRVYSFSAPSRATNEPNP